MEKQDEAREGFLVRALKVSIPEGQNPRSFVKVHNHTRTGTPCGQYISNKTCCESNEADSRLSF